MIVNESSFVHTYSVIIPHWNCLAKLQRCLNSIPARTDIQVIVVDDCSPNCTLQDIEALKKSWGQYLVLSTGTNRGGGAARNIGLDNATGHWLVFADADDYFTDNAFDSFDKHACFNGEMVFYACKCQLGSLLSLRDREVSPEVRSAKRSEAIVNYQKNPEKILLLLFDSEVLAQPWGKMCSNEFVKTNHVRFQESSALNDLYFHASLICFGNKFKVSEEIVYVYLLNEASTTYTDGYRKLSDRLLQAAKTNKLLLNYGYGYKQLPFDYTNWAEYVRNECGFLPFCWIMLRIFFAKHRRDPGFRRYLVILIKKIIRRLMRGKTAERFIDFLEGTSQN